MFVAKHKRVTEVVVFQGLPKFGGSFDYAGLHGSPVRPAGLFRSAVGVITALDRDKVGIRCDSRSNHNSCRDGRAKAMFKLKNRREVFGGITITVFGILAIVEGYRLGTGTLTRMQPGYVPLALGIVLVLLGFLMSVGRDTSADGGVLLEKPEWRGWLCIIAGVAAFMVLGPHAGLVPAAFSCVFISALGDRTATVKGAFILSVSVTAFGVVLFHYLLTIPMSLFWW
jgi:hypothetical protein